MATQVRETSAGKSLSAYVVLNKKGEHVATVNAHFANSGRVSVDVWNIGDKATRRCFDAAMAALKEPARSAAIASACKAAKSARSHGSYADLEAYAAYDLFGMQQGSAGGGGYDKFAAALAGCWIDGQQIADHCGTVGNAEKAKAALFAQYCKFHDYSGEVARATEKGWDRKHWDKRAAAIGACFANWSSEKNRFTSLHFTAGLPRLEALGYTVIQAI